MATDPNKKTLRHFQCRDYLWETFEQMSAELECSVDYLINEAMRQYARSRSYGARGPNATGNVPAPPSGSDSSGLTTPPPAGPAGPGGPPASRGAALPPARKPAMPPVIPGGVPAGGPPPRGPLPSVPNVPMGGGGPRIPSLPGGPMPPARPPGAPAVPLTPQRPSLPGVPAMGHGPPPGAPLARPSAPPPLPPPGRPAMPTPGPGQRVPAMPGPPPGLAVPPRAAPMAPPPAAAVEQPGTAGSSLSVLYQGQRYFVRSEEFVIGRGQKTSDLVIKDSNVSRRHAVVVLHNGQYWIVDQQSTNGIEYMGAKIERKRIDDGDVFKICDYELVFSYQ